MVLTDVLGRSIKAEPVSLDGDKLVIRREDGRVFELSLASLVDADQQKLQAWQKENPADPGEPAASPAPTASPAAVAPEPDAASEAPAKPARNLPDPKKITLSLSRVKTDTVTLAKWEGYSHKHEMWGYSFEIANRNLYPVQGLRVEYNLLARTFADSSTPAVVTGRLEVPAVATGRSESVRTRTAEVCKQRGVYTYNTGGELRGVWARLYLDDQLIDEQIVPASLKEDHTWRPAR